MKLSQKQLTHHVGGYEASRIMHKAINAGCTITYNERGRKVINLCELIAKTGDNSAMQIAEKLRIKSE